LKYFIYDFCIKFTNELSILEIYKLSTSNEDTGLKLTFFKTKVLPQASSLEEKKMVYEKHKEGIDSTTISLLSAVAPAC